MSQENVELIRRAYEVFNRGELSAVTSEDVHAMVTELLHPDVEWHDQRELPGATVHHRVEEVERHLAAARDALDYYRMDLVEIVDAGRCVVAVYQVNARGRLSGAPVERDVIWVYTFRGAKVERVEIFGTRREALEAVGLRE
jgi:ketosteroid isomerase-like protein